MNISRSEKAAPKGGKTSVPVATGRGWSTKGPSVDAFKDRGVFIDFCRNAAPLLRRDDFVLHNVANKRVLDVGCIDHSVEKALSQGGMWLHRRIADKAVEVLGLDIDEEGVKFFSDLGFRITQGDAENFKLGRCFDIIVGADVIEHLPNPGSFLECASEHIDPGGSILLTTPNPLSFEQIALVTTRNAVLVNHDHTAWFTPHTLHTLARKTGLMVTDFSWLYHERGGLHSHGSPLRRAVGALMSGSSRWRRMCSPDFGVLLRPIDQK